MTANLLARASLSHSPSRPDADVPRPEPGDAERSALRDPGAEAVPAGSRHGALTVPAAEHVLGAEPLRALLGDGTWVEIVPGVAAPSGLAGKPAVRAEAALLRAGPHAVLSGPTAVAMHGCTEADGADSLHVTVPYDQQPRPSPGLVVRQAWIRESDVLELDGLRVYTLDAALAELLCTGPPRTALACLEQAMAVLGGAALRFRSAVTEQVARRNDRRGTRRAAELLDLARTSPSGAMPVVARIHAASAGVQG